MTTGLCVIKGDDVKSGKTLIDKAAEICGSYSALAERIGTSKQALSDMKHGKREISPETAAMLADIAHEDAREAVIQAVIERNRTGPKAETIRAILGKGLAAGVAAVWVFSYSNGWTGAIQTVANSLNQLHIV
jgi:DNA-binding transcriptional regulator YdaS (Cro superfamily)